MEAWNTVILVHLFSSWIWVTATKQQEGKKQQPEESESGDEMENATGRLCRATK